MMKQTIAMALVLSCSAFLRADDTKYAPEGKKFEVSFPGKPTESDIGKGTGKMLLLPAEAGKAVYIFYHNEFPKDVDVSNKDVAATIFKSGLEGGLRSWKGTVTKERDFMVNKMYPAKEFEIDAPNIGIIKLQLILTRTEFYQVAVGGTKEFVNSASAKKFVDSFNLKD
jgi:hypothetical protein